MGGGVAIKNEICITAYRLTSLLQQLYFTVFLQQTGHVYPKYTRICDNTYLPVHNYHDHIWMFSGLVIQYLMLHQKCLSHNWGYCIDIPITMLTLITFLNVQIDDMLNAHTKDT